MRSKGTYPLNPSWSRPLGASTKGGDIVDPPRDKDTLVLIEVSNLAVIGFCTLRPTPPNFPKVPSNFTLPYIIRPELLTILS